MDAGKIQEIEKRAIGFLQESDGSQSSTRLCLVLVIIFSLGFVTALLCKVHGPITIAEFCSAVGSIGEFAIGVGGPLYAVNRAMESVDNRAKKGPQE